MDTLLAVLIVAAIVLLVAIVIRATTMIVTVHDYERGLRYTRGRFRGLVEAGSYVAFRPLTEIRLLDARPTFMTVEGQEVLLADGTSVKVSLAARYVLGDAVAAVTGDRDPWRSLYLTLQLRMREEIAGRTLDQVIADRLKIGPAIRENSATAVAVIGLELLAVEVRDVMIGGDLRRAYASVVAARKDGEAALERARAETAALRNLANAGRLVEDNPGLLQLRLLQQVGGTSGNTLMINVPDGAIRPVAGSAGTGSSGGGAARAGRRPAAPEEGP